MKLSLFKENERVLLVGEGNFSFAVTLVKNNLNVQLTATCYENNAHDTGKKNIDFLRNHGIRVLLGVDATKLEEHEILSSKKFDVVVFNFPHVGGKMRIEKNRDLLRRFFISVKSVLEIGGNVFVSLCDGQGGTPADTSIRTWNDSWQITEMAAHGDFILIRVEPFDSSLFQNYTVTGYRSLEKQFNTKGSLTHIFKVAEKPNIDNIVPKQKIDLEKLYSQSIEYNNILDKINIREDNDSLVMYPNTYKFDITFSIPPKFSDTKLYEMLYNHAGLIIDNVEFVGSYTFPDLRKTKTYRITYKSHKFPMHRKSVISLHENVISNQIEKMLHVTVSR